MPETTRPPWMKSGYRISAPYLRKLAASIVQRLSVPGGQVERHGTSIGIVPPYQAKGASIRQFYLWEINNDFLLGNTWDGTTIGERDFYIAKPWMLRRTPFDDTGATTGDYSSFTITRNGVGYKYDDEVTREATDSTSTEEEPVTETQVIVPSYVVGDTIYAAHGIVGGTEVLGADGVADRPVKWLDLNNDGRAWAKATE